MRHFASIVLSLILAPVIYLLIGVGVFDVVTNASTSTHQDYVKVTAGILALLGAAVLYSPLVLSRLSPIGPALVGLAFLVISGWAVFAFASLTDVMPHRVLGVEGAAVDPAGPITLLLGVPLLLTTLSPRRWRRYASGGPSTVAMPSGPVSYPPPAGYQPSYPPPAGYQPATGSGGQPLDPTRPLFPPPLTPPVMQPPVSPAPAPSPVEPVDPDAPTHRLGT